MAHVTFLGANEALAALAAAQHHMVYTSYRKSTNVFLHTFHNGLVNRTSRSSSTKIYLPLCHTTSEWIYSNSIGRSTVFSGLKKGEKSGMNKCFENIFFEHPSFLCLFIANSASLNYTLFPDFVSPCPTALYSSEIK